VSDTTRRLAKWIEAKNIAPNLVSQGSVALGAACFLSFFLSSFLFQAAFLFLGAALIQASVLASRIDDLVAQEGQMQTYDRVFWNEFPDRVADCLALAGVGFALGLPSLGLLAAIGALLASHLNTMSLAQTGQEELSGPMTRQAWMMALTVTALAGGIEAAYSGTHFLLFIGLCGIIAGIFLTTAQRARNLLGRLSRKS
jgi:phosphatidylglycerophosphate synthase